MNPLHQIDQNGCCIVCGAEGVCPNVPEGREPELQHRLGTKRVPSFGSTGSVIARCDCGAEARVDTHGEGLKWFNAHVKANQQPKLQDLRGTVKFKDLDFTPLGNIAWNIATGLRGAGMYELMEQGKRYELTATLIRTGKDTINFDRLLLAPVDSSRGVR